MGDEGCDMMLRCVSAVYDVPCCSAIFAGFYSALFPCRSCDFQLFCEFEGGLFLPAQDFEHLKPQAMAPTKSEHQAQHNNSSKSTAAAACMDARF